MFEFVADFLLNVYVCHSPACLQSRQHPPHICYRPKTVRGCGVAAQRWRFTVRAVSDKGPFMHSTRLHDDAVAAAHGDAIEKSITTF
jgi:hypothetical protein